MTRRDSKSSAKKSQRDETVRPQRWLVELSCVAALAVISLAVMFPDLVTMRGLVIQDDIFTSDIHNFHFPNRAFLAASLKAGVFPLWTPYTYGGFPFQAHIESGSCYPPNLLLYGLLPLVWAQNISVLLPFVVAAMGLYLLAREIGSNRVGAALGALAFMYAGFFISHVKHMDMVQAAAWVPWLFWLIERGIARKNVAYFGAFAVLYGAQILAGFPHISYYTALTCAAYAFFRLLNSRQPDSSQNPSSAWRAWSALAWIVRQPAAWCFIGAGVLGVGIAAVQLIPAFELASLSPRGEGTDIAFATDFAYYLPDVMTFLLPFINGDPGLTTYAGTIFWENYAYLGVLPFLIAVYTAIFQFRSSWYIRFFAVFGLVCFSLVLGKWSPTFYAAYYGLPGFSYFRFPTRFLAFVDMALAILAALGWTRLSTRFQVRNSSVAVFVGVALVSVTFGDLWFVQRRHIPIAPASKWLSAPSTVQYLQSQQPELGRVFSIGAIETHEAAYKMAGGWQGELLTYDLQRSFIQPNTNVLFGLESVDGYMSLVPEYVSAVWSDAIHDRGIIATTLGFGPDGDILVTPEFVRVASAFNVKHFISHMPITHPRLARIPVDGYAYLYENLDVMPRAYVVPKARWVSGDAEALEVMRSSSFRPDREVLLSQRGDLTPSGISNGVSGTAVIESYKLHRVIIQAKMGQSGYLVLADTFYPGWQAMVNGGAVEILRANVSQRAVYLDEGEHEIVFEFRSKTIRWGIAVSGGSLLVLVVVSVGLALRDRSRSS